VKVFLETTPSYEMLVSIKEYVEGLQEQLRAESNSRPELAASRLLQQPVRQSLYKKALQLGVLEFVGAIHAGAEQLHESLTTRKGFDSFADETEAFSVAGGLGGGELTSRQSFLVKFLATQLFQHPFLKSWVNIKYFKLVTVSTEPTAQGNKEIDLLSRYYVVKRIHCRPLAQFTDDIWLLAEKAERLELIRIHFVLPWGEEKGLVLN